MISFAPSEEQQALLETARRFATEQLAPAARAADREGRLQPALRQSYHDLGLPLLGLPESCGGIGFDLIAKVLAEEALAETDAAQAVALDNAGTAAQVILGLAGEQAAAQWLSPLGERHDYVLAFAAAEALPGAHVGLMQTRAERQGDEVRLTGQKRGVYNAAAASRLVVLAREQDGAGLHGVQAYLVEAGAPGLTVTPEDRMGLRAGGACALRLEATPALPLQVAGHDEAALQRVLSIARTLAAARICGSARGALRHAIDYAQDRTAFGKPICAHQGLAFFMADMEVALEGARNLTLLAAWELAQGETAIGSSCAAATHAAEAGVKVTVDAVQVFGGAGFMKDMPVERYMRDVRTLANMAGTPEDHLHLAGGALMPMSATPNATPAEREEALA